MRLLVDGFPAAATTAPGAWIAELRTCFQYRKPRNRTSEETATPLLKLGGVPSEARRGGSHLEPPRLRSLLSRLRPVGLALRGLRSHPSLLRRGVFLTVPVFHPALPACPASRLFRPGTPRQTPTRAVLRNPTRCGRPGSSPLHQHPIRLRA